ncbi:hypothetical protein LWI28_012781 [Acer negundo]|uniref:Uncharacterized protein n=1 Tax=Acer negundo TaxID=4023 RepID=A0AAD5NX63_ACENE|nr:hypothetical protein LWI28_012781 [Acer negundo]
MGENGWTAEAKRRIYFRFIKSFNPKSQINYFTLASLLSTTGLDSNLVDFSLHGLGVSFFGDRELLLFAVVC